jgi:parallel beta-helix repeat protein
MCANKELVKGEKTILNKSWRNLAAGGGEMKMTWLLFLVVLVVITLCSGTTLQPVGAMGIIYIEADGTINPPEAPVSTFDNVVYVLTANVDASIVVERSNIIIDGIGCTVQGDGTGNGFVLLDVVNITVKNTRIENCFDGIQLFNSSDNFITGNAIIGNSYEGVGVYYSFDNIISGNNIRGNQIGLALHNSSDNSIFHNDFADNTNQIYAEFSVNMWDNDYPSGGNFWSDYNGTDAYSGPNQNQLGSDGIGDTSYVCAENNFDNYPLMNPWINIAIVDISPSKSVVGEGYKVYISVTVQNQGWNAQTTKLTVYVNSTVLGIVTDLALPERSQAILNFTWQTTPVLKGNYIISSTADPVPNEPDTTDNNRAYGRTVKVTIIGDVNGDGVVDIYDAITLSNAFASMPDSPTWKGNADINSDNIVDIFDAILLSVNFGKSS